MERGAAFLRRWLAELCTFEAIRAKRKNEPNFKDQWRDGQAAWRNGSTAEEGWGGREGGKLLSWLGRKIRAVVNRDGTGN